MERRFLITGAGGFVGRHLCAVLAKSYPDVTVAPFGTDASPDPIGRALASGDLRDRELVSKVVLETHPQVVIHLAAQSSVARGNIDRDATWSINVAGTMNLALAVAQHAPNATFVFASTAEVYGGSFLGGIVDEQTSICPLSDYARSKAVAESILLAILPPTTNLIIVRPCSHTGPGQSTQFVLPSFATQIAHIESNIQADTLFVGNLDVRRDFLDVRDVVMAYLDLINAAPSLPFRFTANVSSGTSPQLSAVLEQMRSLSQKSFSIVVDKSRLRSIDVPVARIDSSLIRKVTGWAPAVSLDETLRELLAWARDR